MIIMHAPDDKSAKTLSHFLPPLPAKMSDSVALQGSPRVDDPKLAKEEEKSKRKLEKEIKQRQKDAERKKIKDEKKRQKEAEKQEKEEAKERKKLEAKSKIKSNSVQSQPTLDDFRTSADNPIPLFLEKAIHYIEKEGLDAEGLYRVPGNRAHVDLLFQKFDEGTQYSASLQRGRNFYVIVLPLLTDHNVDIYELDIAVNGVATAVKDFFFKRLPPILGPDQMSELEAISSKTRK